MIIGLLKSLLYMVVFFIVMRLLIYLLGFINFLFRKNKKNDDTTTKDIDALKMLQCEKCKTYIAKSEAYMHNGKVFCKKEPSNSEK